MGAPTTTLDVMDSVGPNADPTRKVLDGTPQPIDQPLDPARSVAAIVVVTEPSVELASTLRALSRQDVPITILVVDDASHANPAEIVASIVPDAFVSRLDRSVGWAGAANAGAALVQGATCLLITHDDVAPAPDAVREMVDVAIEYDADLVTPKLVLWSDHERLISVGYSADRSATPVTRVDSNELDQGQHDFVRSIQAADGACLLIRATAFRSIGGFTEFMTAPATAARIGGRKRSADDQQAKRAGLLSGPGIGEDVDLCWRLLRSGGRAFSAPSARVAHAQRRHRSSEVAEPELDVRSAADSASDALRVLVTRRNQVATVWATLRGFAFFRALSALIVQRATLTRSPLPLPAVRRLLAPTGLRGLMSYRRKVGNLATLPHAEPTRLESQLVTGEVTVRKLLGREVAKDSAQALSIAGDAVSVGWRRGPIRLISGLFLLTVVSLFIGSRSIFGGVPHSGQFAPIPGVRSLLRTYGNDVVPTFPTVPTGRGVPGLLIAAAMRIIGFGHEGLVGFLTTTVLIPLGIIGAARLGSAMARAGADQGPRDHATGVLSASLAAALYGATPAGIAAIRTGSWEALLLYGALPWILFAVLFHGGELQQNLPSALIVEPRKTWLLSSAVRVGLPLAVVASLAPVILPVVVGSVLLLWVGRLIAGRSVSVANAEGASTNNSLIVMVSALIVSVVLFAGWLTQLVATPELLRGRGATADPTNVLDILRLAAAPHADGPVGVGGWLTLGIPLAAVITMLLVNELRLRWALRWWMVAIGFASAMWAAERGPLVGLLPSHEVMAVPLSLAMVLVVTIGISAVTQDIRRAQFGWRQTATLTAIAAVLVSVIPLVWSARSGSWGAKPGIARSEAAWIGDSSSDADRFTTLWVGTNESVDGQSFPVGSQDGQMFLGRQARWSVTGVHPATVGSLWGAGPDGEQGQYAEYGNILEQAASGSTFRVGSMLTKVRYIVIVPDADNSPQLRRLANGLNQQLDLRETERRGSVAILENTAYSPQAILKLDKARQPWLVFRWLQLLVWSGATVVFLADWSTRRRHLDQLAAEFDDLVEKNSDDSSDAWDSSLTVEGAFRSDDDLYAEVFDDTNKANFTQPHLTKGRAESSVSVPDADHEFVATQPESLADQLWLEWSQRHGRDQPKAVDTSAPAAPKRDAP